MRRRVCGVLVFFRNILISKGKALTFTRKAYASHYFIASAITSDATTEQALTMVDITLSLNALF